MFALGAWRLVFERIGPAGDGPAAVLIYAIGGLAAIVACGVLSWYLVERPVLRVGRRAIRRWQQRRA